MRRDGVGESHAQLVGRLAHRRAELPQDGAPLLERAAAPRGKGAPRRRDGGVELGSGGIGAVGEDGAGCRVDDAERCGAGDAGSVDRVGEGM